MWKEVKMSYFTVKRTLKRSQGVKSISIIHGFPLQDDDTDTTLQLCFSADVCWIPAPCG